MDKDTNKTTSMDTPQSRDAPTSICEASYWPPSSEISRSPPSKCYDPKQPSWVNLYDRLLQRCLPSDASTSAQEDTFCNVLTQRFNANFSFRSLRNAPSFQSPVEASSHFPSVPNSPPDDPLESFYRSMPIRAPNNTPIDSSGPSRTSSPTRSPIYGRSPPHHTTEPYLEPCFPHLSTLTISTTTTNTNDNKKKIPTAAKTVANTMIDNQKTTNPAHADPSSTTSPVPIPKLAATRHLANHHAWSSPIRQCPYPYPSPSSPPSSLSSSSSSSSFPEDINPLDINLLEIPTDDWTTPTQTNTTTTTTDTETEPDHTSTTSDWIHIAPKLTIESDMETNTLCPSALFSCPCCLSPSRSTSSLSSSCVVEAESDSEDSAESVDLDLDLDSEDEAEYRCLKGMELGNGKGEGVVDEGKGKGKGKGKVGCLVV